MQVLIVVDQYPPKRTSVAVQMSHLAEQISLKGHHVSVLSPNSKMSTTCHFNESNRVEVYKLSSFKASDVGYTRRFFAELLMPFTMGISFRLSALYRRNWDAIIWYSPTIFFGPLIAWLKRKYRCPAYLILRDIFPQWAVDLGLLRKGPLFYFLDRVAKYQYSLADTIGVQSISNIPFVTDNEMNDRNRLEVLDNWLTPMPIEDCSIRVAETALRGRKIFVYVGNMGVAQNMSTLLDVAENLTYRGDIGFLFVGRGSEFSEMCRAVRDRGLHNVLVKDEIDSAEIPGLLNQCYAGLISLDRRHKTHNIPGKFLSYLYAALPIIAITSAKSDLESIVENEAVGLASDGSNPLTIKEFILRIVDNPHIAYEFSTRARDLAAKRYSTLDAASKILATF